MHSDSYDIQELVQISGVPRRTIHFYVQQGILPPPDGAGLAARYNADHLARLRLIPVYRAQGLRLDDIRARFRSMHPESLRQQAALPAVGNTEPHLPQVGGDKSQERPGPGAPLPFLPHGLREQMGASAGFGEEQVTQYALPAGIRLLVPAAVSINDRQRVQQLLQAARQIFSGAGGVFYASGAASTHDKPDSEEKKS